MKVSIRLLIWVLVAAGLLTIGFFAAQGPVHRWRTRRLVASAEAFMKRRDYPAAALNARAILQNDAGNIQACEILAQIAESQHSPAALIWRQRLTELQRGRSEPLVALAVTATGLGEAFVAEDALSRVPERDRDTSAYHQAVAAWAFAIHQSSIAEAHFQKALDLDPQNRFVSHSPPLESGKWQRERR